MRKLKLVLAMSIIFAACAALSAQDHHNPADCKNKSGKAEAKKVDSPEKASKTAKTKAVTFSVNMHCGACKQKVEKNIAWEKGVKDMKVDLDAKTVKITYDPNKTSEESLKKAIEKLDFTCDVKS
ncbi:MAG: heavy-metal-associated domain-containing protein [Prevotellaceae bacterium]|jgi:copper chaperone CopZ|nr:heavy-metal-associated domain-containing protein [Prevotellaceae bacterium]